MPRLQTSHNFVSRHGRANEAKDTDADKPHDEIIKIAGGPVERSKGEIEIGWGSFHRASQAVKKEPRFDGKSGNVTDHIENDYQNQQFEESFHVFSFFISASNGWFMRSGFIYLRKNIFIFNRLNGF